MVTRAEEDRIRRSIRGRKERDRIRRSEEGKERFRADIPKKGPWAIWKPISNLFKFIFGWGLC